MIPSLFGSKSRVKILAHILKIPKPMYLRELSRALDLQISIVRRELSNLEALGIVESREKGRKKYYALSTKFPFTAQLYTIIFEVELKGKN